MARETLVKFSHILAAVLILLHSLLAYDNGHASAIIFLLLGLSFLLLAIFHHKLSQRYKKIDAVFYLIEAVAIAATSYDYFHEGKKYLPYVYLAAMLPYLVIGILSIMGRLPEKKINWH